MKKNTFLLLALLLMASASATEYLPLVREGVKWVEYYNNTINNTQFVKTYQFSGNIEIGGNIYSKLYSIPKVSNVAQDGVLVAYVREQDKKVYCIPVDAVISGCVLSNEDIDEYMIYNFNDIISPYTIEEEFITPITTEQMPLGDRLVNMYNLGGTKRIAEGIGCLENVFYDPWPIVLPDGSHTSLAWFEENGEILFKGEDFEAAVDYLSDYVPLVREGVVWEYVGHYHFWPDQGYKTEQLYTLEINGTTEVDGELYHNVYRTEYNDGYLAQEPYLVAYVREENKVVTAIDNEKHWWFIPQILYDFNKPMFLPDSETAEALGIEDYYELELIDYYMDRYIPITVEVAGALRNGYHINYDDGVNNYYPDYEAKIIEGIGVDCRYGDLLVPYRDYLTSINPMSSLSAVYEEGELVYKGNAYNQAQELKNPDAITTISGDKQVAGVRYYNLAGVESCEPWQGVNIRVTTYADGSRHTDKVINDVH